MSYETSSAHIILSAQNERERQAAGVTPPTGAVINPVPLEDRLKALYDDRVPDYALKPQPRIPSLYSTRKRSYLAYEAPRPVPILSTKLPEVPLNPHIFPQPNEETGRIFEVPLMEDTPAIRAQMSEEEEREFDNLQEDLFALDRTQRVLEFVGTRINRGEGYMQRMSDAEFAEHGVELRPSTKFELKVAKRLEKIERERREELHRLFILEDPDYAEISGRDSMTPSRNPAATKKELKHHANNRKVRAHLQHRIHELDEEFRLLITTPQRVAAQMIEDYEQQGRPSRIGAAARRIGRLATSGGRNFLNGTESNRY